MKHSRQINPRAPSRLRMALLCVLALIAWSPASFAVIITDLTKIESPNPGEDQLLYEFSFDPADTPVNALAAIPSSMHLDVESVVYSFSSTVPIPGVSLQVDLLDENLLSVHPVFAASLNFPIPVFGPFTFDFVTVPRFHNLLLTANVNDVPGFPTPTSGSASGQFAFSGNFGMWPETPVPEPATLALIGLGLAGLGFSRRRKAA